MSLRLESQPFPYASLPAISHDEIWMATRVRELAQSVRPEGVAAALSELIGGPVTLAVRRTRPFDPTRVPADAIGVAFAPADEVGLARAALIEVEGALASALVARALRQRPPRMIDTTRGASPEVAGALAALLHATLRRAHAGIPFRVVAAGPGAALARDLAANHPRIVTAWLSVVVDQDAFDARVSLPIVGLGPPTNAIAPISAISALGDAPLALPLVVASCLTDRAELGALVEGDAFVLPDFALQVSASHSGLVGPVTLVPPRQERGLVADLGEDGGLVLRSGPLASCPWDVRRDGAPSASGESMSGDTNQTLEVVQDAPIVVRVELGAVEMTAREWAALAPGDVVALRRKLGDPAILRVGGVEVARGELVQVDGEYGVRILGRPADGGRG